MSWIIWINALRRKSNTIVCKHYKMFTSKNRGRESQIIDVKMMQFIQREGNKKTTINSNYLSMKKPSKGIITNKYLKFFHESVKIFALSNNVYLNQISEMDLNDIMSYTNKDEEITEEVITKQFNINELKISLENKINFLFLNYTSIEQTKLLANSMKQLIFDFMSSWSNDNHYHTSQSNNDNSFNNLTMSSYQSLTNECSLDLYESVITLDLLITSRTSGIKPLTLTISDLINWLPINSSFFILSHVCI